MNSLQKISKTYKFNVNKEKNTIYAFLIIVVVNFISHFLYFKRFGLYEDDYYNIGINLGISFPRLLETISYYITEWVQGHPLAFLPYLFTYIGELFGDFYYLYIIAFVITSVNSFLMYKILKKVFPDSGIFAISGALAFCLFPPDTTKTLLLHAFVLQISLLFLLYSTLLYLNDRKILSYMIIILSLFSYESPFMVFFGVPLLLEKYDTKFKKDFLKHILILGSIIIVILIYRKMTGESRIVDASESSIISIMYKTIIAMFLGPVMNLYIFLRTPIVTIDYWIRDKSFWWYYDYIFYFLGFCFFAFIWLFKKTNLDKYSEITKISGSGDKIDNIACRQFLNNIMRLFVVGLILLSLGYAASFTHYPPTTLMGRNTSVHLAATFGGSILFAVIITLIFFLSEKYKFKLISIFIVSLYLALLVGYCTIAQKEYVLSWMTQKSYWKEIIELCPDIDENTVILSDIGNENYFITKYIDSFSPQSDKWILGSFIMLPDGIKQIPCLALMEDWQNMVENRNGDLILNWPPIITVSLKDSNVIYLQMDKNSKLVRSDNTNLSVKGKTLLLKPKGENTFDRMNKTKLYDLMIKSE